MVQKSKICLNKELESLIVQHSRNGLSRKEISEKTGYLYLSGISNVLRKHNIPTNNRLIENKQLVENVIQLYDSGMSLNEISKIVGSCYSAISNLLKKLNIRTPTKMKYYNQDDMFFNNINTEEKAYWFGFIIADGNVSKLGTTLTIVSNEKDSNHMELFLKSINSTNTIKKYKTVKMEQRRIWSGHVYTLQQCANPLYLRACVQTKQKI